MATYPLSESYADGQVLTAANVNSITEGVNDIAFGVLNAQTNTTYTLALTDVAKVITLSNAGAITLTVPTNASVAFPIGSTLLLVQLGAGQVSLSYAGVTMRSAGSKYKMNGQYSVCGLMKLDTDTWVFYGNTAL